MESISNYFNEIETKVIDDFKNKIKSIKLQQNQINLSKYKNDKKLQMKKYYNNLFRQIDYLKDDLYALQSEKITEVMFYQEKFINEKNIDNLNKDILQIINEFDFGGSHYLFYKETNEDYYKITTNIDEMITLIKEGWIDKIYKGKYNKNEENFKYNVVEESSKCYYKDNMNILFLQNNCELIFDRKTMLFKKTNILDIRKTTKVYCIAVEINKDIDHSVYFNSIIRDIDDYYKIEDYITKNNFILKSIELRWIDGVFKQFAYNNFEMRIVKAELYNKVKMNTISLNQNSLLNTLHDKINTFMNKDKPNNWEDEML